VADDRRDRVPLKVFAARTLISSALLDLQIDRLRLRQIRVRFVEGCIQFFSTLDRRGPLSVGGEAEDHCKGFYTKDSDSTQAPTGLYQDQLRQKRISPCLCPSAGYCPAEDCERDAAFSRMMLQTGRTSHNGYSHSAPLEK
jgi:hypothetical protein